jgi:hypothetical protein
MRRGVYEIDLEGDFDHVSEKVEELIKRLNPRTSADPQPSRN